MRIVFLASFVLRIIIARKASPVPAKQILSTFLRQSRSLEPGSRNTVTGILPLLLSFDQGAGRKALRPRRHAWAPKAFARKLQNRTFIDKDLSEKEGLWTGPITIRDVSESQKKQVGANQKWRCAKCDCLLPATYQVDHITPLALGGTNGLANLQALCPKCHTSKTRKQRHIVIASRAARHLKNKSEAIPPARALKLDSIDVSSLKLLSGMNRQQLAAVVNVDGPMRVAAGPGTGKTRVLTARIAYLIIERKVKPRRVLSVTFTNKAARELRQRITSLIGPKSADAITMGTFHSICLAILRVDIEKLPAEFGYFRGFTVYDDYAALKLITKLKEKVEGVSMAGKKTSQTKKKEELRASVVQAIISAAKNDGYDAKRFRANTPTRRLGQFSEKDLILVASVFELYEKTMREENVVDYDDMLLLTEVLLRKCERTRLKYARHWNYITVDEFQDTNSIQYQILSLLGRDHRNIFAVGDADQAIYGWRGADIRNQQRFDSDFTIRKGAGIAPAPLPASAFANVKAFKKTLDSLPILASTQEQAGQQLALELNYRSHQSILDMAERLLAPAYAHDPASQLHLVTPQTYRNRNKKETSIGNEVVVVELEDSDDEAQFVVDEIIRLRMIASAANEMVPSVAILYRTNKQSMAFERLLVRQGVPYILAAQRSFYARKEIRDALAYLRVLRSNDSITLERIINVPPRGIGAVTLANLHVVAEACNVSLWRAIELYTVAPEDMGDDTKKSMPKLSSKSYQSLCAFYSLIQRFRALVTSQIDKNIVEVDGDAVDLRIGSSQVPYQSEIHHAHSGQSRQSDVIDMIDSEFVEDTNFHTRQDGIREAAEDVANNSDGSLEALLRLLMLESGYEKLVKGDEDGEYSGRWRNLGELANIAKERRVSEIDEFLDQIALVADVDALDDQGIAKQQERASKPVQLSTIHGAKGLEFDHVFVVGVEEGLLPHYLCQTREEIEEERRLLYVAMTRAKKQLTLTCADVRGQWGNAMPTKYSRFLDDLPNDLNHVLP